MLPEDGKLGQMLDTIYTRQFAYGVKGYMIPEKY